MFYNLRNPIVFAGSSLEGVNRAKYPNIEFCPPASRGDLELLVKRKAGTVVLIDGLFGSKMAVAPAECRHLLENGWLVIGASSMGALRASELWSVGMIGIGEVFTMFRLGCLRSDADVAVAYHPDSYEELTASVIHIRSVLSKLRLQALISSLQSRQLLKQSKEIFWYERDWQLVLDSWSLSGISKNTLEIAKNYAFSRDYHPKKRDAELALQVLTARMWMS